MQHQLAAWHCTQKAVIQHQSAASQLFSLKARGPAAFSTCSYSQLDSSALTQAVGISTQYMKHQSAAQLCTHTGSGQQHSTNAGLVSSIISLEYRKWAAALISTCSTSQPHNSTLALAVGRRTPRMQHQSAEQLCTHTGSGQQHSARAAPVSHITFLHSHR
jgi:hypothetical protein